MTPADLFPAFRSDTGDSVEPYLWSDEDLVRYAAAAEFAFVEGVGGVLDRTSVAARGTVKAGVQAVPKHPAVLDVEEARLSDGRKLDVISINKIDPFGAADGDPRALVPDADDKHYLLDHVPLADGTLSLVVYRLPLRRVDDKDATMEVPDRYFDTVLSGMKARAYMKNDAETFDRDAADRNEATFQAKIRAAYGAFRRQREPVRVVEYGGC